MNSSHSQHQTILLSENEQGAICKCKGCNRYTIAYKTVVIPFSKKGFYAFEKALKRFRANDFNTYHPQGMKAVMRNNQTDMSISLTFGEVQELLSMYRDVHVMEEVFSVLSE